MDLLSLRKEIDEVDSELQSLLRHRLEIVERIGEYKAENNIPFMNEEREREILQHIDETAGDDAEYLKSIFREIMKSSREFEEKIFKK